MVPEVMYEGDRRRDQSEYIGGGAAGPAEETDGTLPDPGWEWGVVGGEIGKELNHFSLAGGRKLALLRSQVEFEPNMFDDLGGLCGGLLEIEAQAVVGAPDVPKVAEDSCLCFGREEEK